MNNYLHLKLSTGCFTEAGLNLLTQAYVSSRALRGFFHRDERGEVIYEEEVWLDEDGKVTPETVTARRRKTLTACCRHRAKVLISWTGGFPYEVVSKEDLEKWQAESEDYACVAALLSGKPQQEIIKKFGEARCARLVGTTLDCFTVSQIQVLEAQLQKLKKEHDAAVIALEAEFTEKQQNIINQISKLRRS